MDPLLFARQLLVARNAAQLPGLPDATLRKVLVFRGQPSPEHDSKGYARNQAQKAHSERDKRVLVTLRPLKYEYQLDATGRPATDALGRRTVLGAPREKGVDVLCTSATVREAQPAETDLVILVSSDTDLAPTLDEVVRLGTSKIETACWWDSTQKRGFQLHPTDRSVRSGAPGSLRQPSSLHEI